MADQTILDETPPRRRLRPKERERQIVDGAIRYFAEVGFEGQTRELARRLNITQPLLFRYFPTKEDLIDRVYEDVYLRRWKDEWVDDLTDRSVSLEERLIRYYEDYVATIFRYEWIRIFMFSGLKGEPINQRYMALVRDRILRAISLELRHEHGFPADDITPLSDGELDVAWSLHGAIFYVGIRKWVYQEDIPSDLSAFIRRNVQMFLRGARPALEEVIGAPSGVD